MSEVRGITPLELIRNGSVNISRVNKTQASTPHHIVSEVAKYYDLTLDEMRSKSRVRHIKDARQVAMYLLSEELSISTNKIAVEVGVKDHSTVMHGIKRIKDNLKLDFDLREQIAKIKGNIYA